MCNGERPAGLCTSGTAANRLTLAVPAEMRYRWLLVKWSKFRDNGAGVLPADLDQLGESAIRDRHP
jgi:hypothetical protein